MIDVGWFKIADMAILILNRTWPGRAAAAHQQEPGQQAGGRADDQSRSPAPDDQPRQHHADRQGQSREDRRTTGSDVLLLHRRGLMARQEIARQEQPGLVVLRRHEDETSGTLHRPRRRVLVWMRAMENRRRRVCGHRLIGTNRQQQADGQRAAEGAHDFSLGRGKKGTAVKGTQRGALPARSAGDGYPVLSTQYEVPAAGARAVSLQNARAEAVVLARLAVGFLAVDM